MERHWKHALVAAAAAAAALMQYGALAETAYFDVTKGAGPHDVAAAPGANAPVYYTAQRSGKLGILDPKSGKVDEVPLGRGSAPHGVVVGPDGAPWVTDGGLNAIVRVDPKTREVKTWPLPKETGYANLNTLTFDKKGRVWFTGQSGYYGRVDPKTGDVKVWDAPRGRGPYGITTTPSGDVWYASLAGNHIAHVDTETGQATVVEPPTKDQGARRVWSDSKGMVWVAEWNAGNLSRYDPKGNSWKTWKAPGDRPRVYAVYVDETDKVWASEWTAQVMLRFDPATEKFESFKSSSRGPNVRQIHGRKGEVWTPESGADKIVVYRYR